MSGSIFIEALRQNWRQTLIWGGTLLSLGWLTLAIIPDAETLQQFIGLLDALPSGFLQAFGMEDTSVFSTIEGYLSVRYFTLLVWVLAIYGVIAGLSISANDEDSGSMDVTLSLPVTRWRVVVERYLAYILLSVVIVIMGTIGLALGALMSTEAINFNAIMATNIAAMPITLIVIAFTALCASLWRRNQAIGVVAGVLIASYFVDNLGKAASGSFLGTLRELSPFRYYDSQTVMAEGLSITNLLILVVASAVFLVLAVYRFNHRDIGV